MPEDYTGSIVARGPLGDDELDDDSDSLPIVEDIDHIGEYELEQTAYGRYRYTLIPVGTDGKVVALPKSRISKQLMFRPPPPSNDMERVWHQIAKAFPEFGTWPDIRLLPDVKVEYRSNKCGFGAEACVDRDELAAGRYTVHFSKSFTPSAYYHEIGHIIHYLAWPEASRTGATPEAISSWHEVCEVEDHQYEYYCDSWEEWVAVAFEDSVRSGRIEEHRCGPLGFGFVGCVGTGVEIAVSIALGDS